MLTEAPAVAPPVPPARAPAMTPPSRPATASAPPATACPSVTAKGKPGEVRQRFNQAFRTARQKGYKQFKFNGKLFTTDVAPPKAKVEAACIVGSTADSLRGQGGVTPGRKPEAQALVAPGQRPEGPSDPINDTPVDMTPLKARPNRGSDPQPGVRKKAIPSLGDWKYMSDEEKLRFAQRLQGHYGRKFSEPEIKDLLGKYEDLQST